MSNEFWHWKCKVKIHLVLHIKHLELEEEAVQIIEDFFQRLKMSTKEFF